MDENVDARLAVLLRDEGHDANTVREQGLHGIEDKALYEFCKKEDRLMVMLDLDFSNIIRFPPEGIRGRNVHCSRGAFARALAAAAPR